MSIEQKIAELLAESRKAQELEEEKVKPDGKEGGSNSTTENAVAGDKFIYRVKNEKFYNPIIGVTIYSVNYSDIVNIEILTNVGNTY